MLPEQAQRFLFVIMSQQEDCIFCGCTLEESEEVVVKVMNDLIKETKILLELQETFLRMYRNGELGNKIDDEYMALSALSVTDRR